ESESEIGNEQEVILSYPLWQQLYGSNAEVIGQQVRLSGRPFTIVGVMPKGFEFADSEARFWIPLAFTAQQKSDDFRHSNSWYNIGRLRPGATTEQAQEQVNAINAANLIDFHSSNNSSRTQASTRELNACRMSWFEAFVRRCICFGEARPSFF